MTESPDHLPQLVSSKQAARALGIPEGTLRYWRCTGSGPAWVKLGRRALYSVDDLVEFIARGRRKPSVRTMEVDDVSL
jgi:Helix-turn-helix domain